MSFSEARLCHFLPKLRRNRLGLAWSGRQILSESSFWYAPINISHRPSVQDWSVAGDIGSYQTAFCFLSPSDVAVKQGDASFSPVMSSSHKRCRCPAKGLRFSDRRERRLLKRNFSVRICTESKKLNAKMDASHERGMSTYLLAEKRLKDLIHILQKIRRYESL